MMTRKQLLARLNLDQIEGAIEAAERKTSAELRVCVAPWFFGNVERAARRAFVRLAMAQTRAHNGVLLFIVPARRRFVILGDAGIHAKVGQAFWDRIRTHMADAFREGRFTDGIVAGLEALEEGLAEHFPAAPGDNPDELPNTVDLGG